MKHYKIYDNLVGRYVTNFKVGDNMAFIPLFDDAPPLLVTECDIDILELEDFSVYLYDGGKSDGTPSPRFKFEEFLDDRKPCCKESNDPQLLLEKIEECVRLLKELIKDE